jgi:hypothetical protein
MSKARYNKGNDLKDYKGIVCASVKTVYDAMGCYVRQGQGNLIILHKDGTPCQFIGIKTIDGIDYIVI